MELDNVSVFRDVILLHIGYISKRADVDKASDCWASKVSHGIIAEVVHHLACGDTPNLNAKATFPIRAG